MATLSEQAELQTQETEGGQALVARYKKNYWIPDNYPLTESQCLFHWDLERSLRAELLASTPQNRRDIFARCYERLYSQLPWLHAGDAAPNIQGLQPWATLLGKPPSRVYEVGSGRGALARFLAEQGFECRGSEITDQRGERHVSPLKGLTWGETDGVHLDQFESAGTYDAVISDQVLEHLHPDDLAAHFGGALAILKTGGRYLFRTPSSYAGPTDVSRVFESSTLQGMHLKEYTAIELRTAALSAGFSRVNAVMRLPRRLSWLGPRVRVSRLFIVVSVLIDHFPAGVGRLLVRAGLLPRNVWLVAEKE